MAADEERPPHKTSAESERRRSPRFSADANALAWISLEPDVSLFHKDIVAIVLDESYEGFGILLVGEKFETGDEFMMKVGPLAPVPSRVAWVKELEPGILKLGVEWFEETE